MPGSYIDDGNKDYYSAENLANVSDELIDNMVTRILLPMAKYGVLDENLCTSGVDCHDMLYAVNATSPEHQALAERIATESVILLQNDKETLPLPSSSGPT